MGEYIPGAGVNVRQNPTNLMDGTPSASEILDLEYLHNLLGRHDNRRAKEGQEPPLSLSSQFLFTPYPFPFLFLFLQPGWIHEI